MEKLTLKKVNERLVEINNCKDDDEVAHSKEDDLFYDFVENIKNGNYKTKKEIELIATELFKVRDIDFARWHA